MAATALLVIAGIFRYAGGFITPFLLFHACLFLNSRGVLRSTDVLDIVVYLFCLAAGAIIVTWGFWKETQREYLAFRLLLLFGIYIPVQAPLLFLYAVHYSGTGF